MPVHFLLKKIVSGKILTRATVLMTTRPNAVSRIGSLDFDKTVEILGFTLEQVEDYVQKFTRKGDKAETIKQHITSNLNLLAFCYVPVNCYIICTCLLQLLGNTTVFTSRGEAFGGHVQFRRPAAVCFRSHPGWRVEGCDAVW